MVYNTLIHNFTYTFTTSKSPEEVFNTLINPRNWWIGLHHEIITGKSENLNDEFIFDAGNGVHYTVQRLIEVTPYEKIVWEVIESKLTFVNKMDEWTGTKICFEIFKEADKTKIVFTHEGLIPQFECFGGCSGAWSQYMEKFEKDLNQ